MMKIIELCVASLDCTLVCARESARRHLRSYLVFHDSAKTSVKSARYDVLTT
ncbi:MAG TPA: hypothetical protein VGJ92_11160 [Methanocella sp.]|jgi:hypothetical protein